MVVNNVGVGGPTIRSGCLPITGYTVQCAHLLKCRVLTSENYCERHLVSLIGFSMLIPDFTGAEKVSQGLGGPSVYSKWYQRLSLDLQGLQVTCIVFSEDLTYTVTELKLN